MSKQEETIEVCGKKVVARYARTQEEACASCAFCSRKECHDLDCNLRDIIGEGECRYAYFVEVEQSEEKDYKKLYEGLVNSEWYKKYYQGASVGDSVAVEQPEADLEAEIGRWWNERYAKVDKNYKFDSTSGHYLDNEGIIDLARHFAGWGTKHLKK